MRHVVCIGSWAPSQMLQMLPCRLVIGAMRTKSTSHLRLLCLQGVSGRRRRAPLGKHSQRA